MGRVKKGKTAVRKDLLANAGGIAAVVQIMKSKNITSRDTDYSSNIWSEISSALFGKDDPKNRHWLWVVWTKNRSRVRDLVHIQQENSKQDQKRKKLEEEVIIEDMQMIEEDEDEVGKETDDDVHIIEEDEDEVGKETDEDVHIIEEDEDGMNEETDEDVHIIEDEVGKETDEDVHIIEEDEDGMNKETDEDVQIIEEKTLKTYVQTEVQPQQDSELWRKLPAVPKVFTITVERDEWKTIVPLHGSLKLRRPWTNVLYNSFRKKNPCCTLAFKSQHIKPTHSRKINSPYLNITAVCTFPSCSAKYFFIMKRKPKGNTGIKISVQQKGQIKHKKSERQFRPASYTRRGRIAKALRKGVSHIFYAKLRKTPIAELISGNITRSLNKNVLKVIRSEYSKSQRIHDDVFMEMYLTQKIIKECDTQFQRIPGYIQHLQIDPFGVHMYTETGINILVQHLRKKTPLSLYLDATGSVSSKVPGQNRRILYYSLTLPGGGQSVPPLPVCEMLTTEHSIPPITFWLMQFLRHLSQYTKVTVHQVETDYSWALINSVLLSFNKESIFKYLDRAFAICSGQMTSKDIYPFTVLHMCSAHLLKAVAHSIGKKTDDKGLKAFATFAFARLQNTTSLKEALNIFWSLCIVLCGKQNSNSVLLNLNVMQELIMKGNTPDLDKTEKLEKSIIEEEEEAEEQRKANTIIARSPFTNQFKEVLDEVLNELGKEQDKNLAGNPYYCPGIVDLLFDGYLGIFPLWSGLLLGDLKRHAIDKDEKNFDSKKTRDTNCHVERWFGIIKQSILQKQRQLTPATFIRKMYGTLQGRYREHIMCHNLSAKLLLTQGISKDITQSQEGWAKRDGDKPHTGHSKYFSSPSTVPVPKRVKYAKNSDKGKKTAARKSSSNAATKDGTKSTKEVECLWTGQPTEVVAAVVRNDEQKLKVTLRQREFQSLRPHELLIGEVIEGYIRVVLNANDTAGRLYQFNHYTMGAVLYGTREQVARQSLKSVRFDDYEGIIGFVNMNNVHWKFVYLHAPSSHIFVVDPLQGSNEVEDSRMAGYRFEQYFKMRRNRLGKEDWVNIKWKPGVITHTFQKDGTSCGVFVMQMAKLTAMAFPDVPNSFHIEASKRSIEKLRGDMAQEILKGSDSRDEFCSFCGSGDLLHSAVPALWIQCETCGRWFHTKCIGMTPAQIPDKDTPWYCVLCNN